MSGSEDAVEAERGPWSQFRERFARWWSGEDDREPGTQGAPEGLPVGPVAPQPSDPNTAKGWPPERIKITEALFGSGFQTVGGAAAAMNMARTLGVNKESTVIQLGSGLGGFLQLLATEMGVWVVGYEPSAELAAAATRNAEAAKLGRQARTICRPLLDMERKPRADCIFAKETLYQVENKARLFKIIDETLKPRGVIAFTDYVLPSPGHDSKLLAAWRATEREKPYLVDVETWKGMISAKGYTFSISKDITKEYMREMVQDFDAFARRLKETEMDKSLKKWILSETERWLIRFACFERGEIKVHRFHALKPADIR